MTHTEKQKMDVFCNQLVDILKQNIDSHHLGFILDGIEKHEDMRQYSKSYYSTHAIFKFMCDFLWRGRLRSEIMKVYIREMGEDLRDPDK